MAECQQWLEIIKNTQGLPDDFVAELLGGRQGLLGRCGGYADGYSKNSQVVSGCVMGHLRNPTKQFIPALFLWANGLPTGSMPRSIQEAFAIKHAAIQAEQPVQPTPLQAQQVSGTQATVIKGEALLEMGLKDWSLDFTHENEWRSTEKEIRFFYDGAPYWETVRWYYKLTKNPDGTYKLNWSYALPMADPKPSDPSIPFSITADNKYPANLVLSLFGNLENDRIIVKDIQIQLR